jgi:transcriptional regulator with XRE-family HTH domain
MIRKSISTSPISIEMRFGDRLRALRKAKGLSQEAFADLCALDRTYISGIERGKRNVSLRNIDLLAKTLGTTISDLTSGL